MEEEKAGIKDHLHGCFWALFLHGDMGHRPPGCMILIAIAAIALAIWFPTCVKSKNAEFQAIVIGVFEEIEAAQETYREGPGNGVYADSMENLKPQSGAEDKTGYVYIILKPSAEDTFAIAAIPGEASSFWANNSYLRTSEGSFYFQADKSPEPELKPGSPEPNYGEDTDWKPISVP